MKGMATVEWILLVALIVMAGLAAWQGLGKVGEEPANNVVIEQEGPSW